MQFLKYINDWQCFRGCFRTALESSVELVLVNLEKYNHVCFSLLLFSKKHTNKRWLMKGFYAHLLSRPYKPKRAVPLVLWPASGYSLASVFGLFTAEIKANQWPINTASYPVLGGTSVAMVRGGGNNQTAVWNWNTSRWLGAAAPQLNQWTSEKTPSFYTACCPQTHVSAWIVIISSPFNWSGCRKPSSWPLHTARFLTA